MEKLYEEIGTKRGQKAAFIGKTTRWYRYQNRVVPVPKRGGTGTILQNVFGTGTAVSKSPDFCNFA